jgi:hypothetical protein
VNNLINQVVASVISLEELFYVGFGMKPRVETMESSPQTALELNKFVVRGWNEGLADYYGVVYSQQSDFFSRSLSQVGLRRNATGELKALKSGQEFAGDAMNYNRFHPDPCMQAPMATSYCQGTQILRLMFRIGSSGSITQEALLKLVLDRMRPFSTKIAPQFSRRVLDFDEIVIPILEGVTLNADACKAVATSVSKESYVRNFSQCNI